MKAFVQQRYGTPEQIELQDVATPTPGPGELLVDVQMAGVHIGDVHMMTGKPYLMRAMGFGVRGPKKRPGSEVAGRVMALGPGVTEFAVGDEVVGIGVGAFSEVCVAPIQKLIPRPTSLSIENAVALPISGLTALQALRDAGRVKSGDRVLVIGAAGAVGRYTVQLAKHFDAHVTGLCSGNKMKLVSELGADEVLDYTAIDAFDGTRSFDLIVDTAGNRPLKVLRRALTRAGTLVIVGSETEESVFGGIDRVLRAALLSPLVHHRLVGLISKECASDVQILCDLAASGVITPVIDRTYKFDQVPDAIEYVKSGRSLGKVLVAV
ncbi:MAG: NAD(P)-dependent alcohol dehydrogenase [Rhodococcus sp. (in: high G+C Gram-positive bacteria)]|jgi:NADPH:quinone reductase-like Zn-dependent oxidoreductase